MKRFLISASILSADFARLGEDAAKALDAGSDMIHFDVMDNHYVPNLTIGPMVLKALRNYGIHAPIEVHLMAEPVDKLIVEFAKSGASTIIFHPEASKDVFRSLQMIKDHGCNTGLAFNPATPLQYLEYIFDIIDIILIMSVNPGFGGQLFIPNTFNKLHQVRRLIKKNIKDIRVEIDGGVKIKNIVSIANAGADIFVVGSEIFNHIDYRTIINQMHVELTKINDYVS